MFSRTTRFRMLAALALAGLALPGAALAGARPRIEKLEPDASMPGGVVKIIGTNFSDRFDEVTVYFDGGTKCTVLEATPEALTVSLPTDAKKGKHSLEVQVGAERSAKVELTILSPEERKDKADEDRKRMEGDGGAAVKFLDLDPPQAFFDRGTLVINCAGKADYPDGTLIELALELDRKRIASSQATVQARVFQGTFGPFQQQLFAGNYMAIASFQLNNQASEIRKAFRATVTDPKKQAEMRQASDHEFVRVGSASDEQYQMKELKDHFASAVARIRGLIRDLDGAYSSAGRSFFRTSDGKLDEEAWTTWLGKRALRAIPEGERDAKIAEWKKDPRFVNPDLTFNDQAWREWLDFKWREEGVLKLMKDHVAYRQRYMVMKYQEDMLRLEEAYAMLLRLGQTRSTDLYVQNHLPVHEKDANVKGADPAMIGGGGMGAISPAHIETVLRKIVKSVGLEETAGGAGEGGFEKG